MQNLTSKITSGGINGIVFVLILFNGAVNNPSMCPTPVSHHVF